MRTEALKFLIPPSTCNVVVTLNFEHNGIGTDFEIAHIQESYD